MKHQLSASVVMYGGADEVSRCIQSLLEETKDSELKLYVIDNASPDGALEELKKQKVTSQIDLLALEKNVGYGGGHNKVLPLLHSKYHAVVNPDIVVHEDVLSVIVDWMEEHPDVVMTTPRLVFPDGRQQNIAKRRPALLPLIARQLPIKALKKYEDHYLMLDEDLSKPTDVEFCSGCFFVIRTEIFRKMGGFDEGYFMYVEDADITRKALEYGRAVYLPQVTVEHAWHREAHKKPRQFMWQVRSMFRYFRKWGFRLK